MCVCDGLGPLENTVGPGLEAGAWRPQPSAGAGGASPCCSSAAASDAASSPCASSVRSMNWWMETGAIATSPSRCSQWAREQHPEGQSCATSAQQEQSSEGAHHGRARAHAPGSPRAGSLPDGREGISLLWPCLDPSTHLGEHQRLQVGVGGGELGGAEVLDQRLAALDPGKGHLADLAGAQLVPPGARGVVGRAGGGQEHKG